MSTHPAAPGTPPPASTPAGGVTAAVPPLIGLAAPAAGAGAPADTLVGMAAPAVGEGSAAGAVPAGPTGTVAAVPVGGAAASVLRVLAAAQDVDGLLEALVPVLGTALPGCDEAGVALLRDGAPLTVAASDPVVRAITEAQYRHGSGPCLTATATGRPVLADDGDGHDPDAQWRALAREAGLGVTLAVPLPGPDDVAGALIFHRRGPAAWPVTATATASALAGYVGQALTVLVRRQFPAQPA